MSSNDVMPRLTEVFRQEFEDDALNLSPGTTAQDVEGWDSLMHINLIVAIEREFKIRFTTREITALQNVGDLISLIERKSNASA
jgi:acyl carrier protein